MGEVNLFFSTKVITFHVALYILYRLVRYFSMLVGGVNKKRFHPGLSSKFITDDIVVYILLTIASHSVTELND
jgi:hypothetical protein